MEEVVILVDENDQEVGLMDKLEAHQKGLLHRAFSVFVFNPKGELLLQQRSDSKYHSAGLWSNTCCSHPRAGELIEQAVSRRLKEEMGLHSNTQFRFSFIYKMPFDNGLTEHEFDHVYFGFSDEIPNLNQLEVKDYKYMTLENLQQDIKANPQDYSVWLQISLPKVIESFNSEKPDATVYL